MIDLHCHSTVSDGALSPSEVVQLAHQNGCTLLALTDHDHTGGLAAAHALAEAGADVVIAARSLQDRWRRSGAVSPNARRRALA